MVHPKEAPLGYSNICSYSIDSIIYCNMAA